MTKGVNGSKCDKRISKWLLVTIIFAIIIALGTNAFFISQSTAIQKQISQKQEQPLYQLINEE